MRNAGQLRVEPGRSLSLISGQIEQAGSILAPGGTITLQGERLSLTGSVDTRNSTGQPGTLRLISPMDLQIQPTEPLTNTAINQALLTNGVVIEAGGDLSVDAPLASPGASPLTLRAGRNLILTQRSRDLVFGGDVTLSSGQDTIVNSTVLVNGSQPHQLTVQAGGDVRLERGNLSNDSVGDQRGKARSQTQIRARNLLVKDAVVAGWIYGSGEGPDIVIEVDNAVTLERGELVAFAPLGSLGNVGNVSIQARQIKLDGSSGQRSAIAVSTDALTPGNSGIVTLNASDSIELIGDIPGPFNVLNFQATDLINLAQLETTITSSAFGFGQSGNISINTDRLVLRDGAGIGIVPGIFATSKGQEGNVAIAAREIDLQGLAAIGSITLGATDAGDVTIRGDRLSLKDGALIVVNSVGVNTIAGSGDAGELRVDVRELEVLKGSSLSAATDTSGAGGKLSVNAERVTLAGVSADGLAASTLRTDVGSGFGLLDGAIATGQGGQLTVNANTLRVLDGGQIIASTNSKGDAGNVEITAQAVEVSGTSSNGIPSLLAAESNGTGAAGTLKVTADQLTIRDRAQASTQSRQGDGGNINLSLTDVLYLRRQGRITATAGIDGQGGNGGNINIEAGFIVASPDENTDISANAFEGSGGQVTIRTNAIFGAEPRDRPTPQSDITASSELGVSGQVKVDVLAPNPHPGLTPLPIVLLDADAQIARECGPVARSQFVITGRGGLPPDPRQAGSMAAGLQDWREPDAIGRAQGDRLGLDPQRSQKWGQQQEKFLGRGRFARAEATGWQVAADKTVRLVAGDGRVAGTQSGCSAAEPS